MFMTVTVRTIMGEEWDFLVSNSTSVIDLKLSIFTKLNRMHPDTQVSTLKIPWDMWQCHIVSHCVTLWHLYVDFIRSWSTRERKWRKTMRPWLNMTFRREIYILYCHLSCHHYNHHLNHDHWKHDDIPGWFSDSPAAEVSQRFHPAPQQCHRLICSLEKKHLITNIDKNGIRRATVRFIKIVLSNWSFVYCRNLQQKKMANLGQPWRTLQKFAC